MKIFINKLLNLFPSQTVYAHCDIPCGIYDPHQMQLAAHTIIRMIQLMEEVHQEGDDQKKFFHDVARITKIKEEHAEMLKHEVRVLWADYFKTEHLEKFPQLHQLVWDTLKLASKARQGTDMAVAEQLLEKTHEIAEIFYKTKGLEPVKVASPYPTKGEIVTYK